MQNPIDRLRDAINSLEGDVGKNLYYYICSVTGRKQRRTDVPWSDHVPMGVLYHSWTLDDAIDQITKLVREQHIWEEVIIPGVVNSLIRYYERCANSEKANAVLDDNLQMLEQFKSQLQLPVEQRIMQSSDEMLKLMMSQLQEGMIRAPKFREECLDSVAALQRMMDIAFPPQYWDDWTEYTVLGRENPPVK